MHNPRSFKNPLSLASLLVSHTKELKNLKPLLKLLYSLISSSLSYEDQGNHGSSAAGYVFKHELEDTVTLSTILFQELHKRLLSCSDDACLDRDVGLTVRYADGPDGKDSGEEMLLLLRCCFLMVRLHPFDQMLTEQFQAAVYLLKKLTFQGISTRQERGFIRCSKLASSQCTYGGGTNLSCLDFSAKSSKLYLHFLQQMLEVYLDEVFAHRPFWECLAISDCVSSTHHNLSDCYSPQIKSVLEIVASHFLLSISGKDVLQTCTGSLFWTEGPSRSSPEVSLPVVKSLINHPVMMSAPILLHSHLICLVSEVIGICVSPEKVGLNVRRVNIYLSTFYDSVKLYCEHMSKLIGFCSPVRIVRRPFESYFRSEIYDRINSMLVDLDTAWRTRSSRMFNKTIYSVAIDAISYLKTNIYIVDESYRDDVLSFFSSLVTRLISVEINEVQLQSFEKLTMQDFCLLASILKLMSCSLLQATRCSSENLCCLIASLKRKDALPGYSSLAGVMDFFAQYNFHIPIEVQQFIIDALKLHLSKNEEFKLIFVHFAGLLSLCLVSGLYILVRGCLYFMLVLMNTLALELGSSELLRLSVELGTESPGGISHATVSSSASRSYDTGSFGISQKTSSVRVASNFQRERRKLWRNQRASEFSEISDEETCNGEIFLKCVLKNRKDIDELADFIECKPWRDYNSRLSSKAKIQLRRYEESARRLRLARMQVPKKKRKSKRKLETLRE